MKAIEGGIYCSSCVGRLAGRSSKNLALRYPASHNKSKCHGAEVEIMESEMPDSGFRMQQHLGYRCSKCFQACEIEENKGTCRGCGDTVDLTAASKVIRREE